MKSTGFLDKEDNLIHEHDLLKVDGFYDPMHVHWYEHFNEFWIHNGAFPLRPLKEFNKTSKIVGNIYDQPTIEI